MLKFYRLRLTGRSFFAGRWSIDGLAGARDEDHTTTLTGVAFDAVRNFLRWTASGQSTLQRKKSLCYDAFALTDHCHPRGTLGLRAAVPAIKINYQGGRRLWV